MAGVEHPLRFCMITTFYPPFSFGGDATYVYRLTNELAQRGHHVDVIHCADSYRILARREPADSVPNHPNVRVHTLRSSLGFVSPLVTQQTGRPFLKRRQIRAILAANTFDVIHFHNISLVGGPGILRYGNGVKLYTIHEHWLVCPMHVLWKQNRELCTKKSCFSCTLTYRRPPQWWRYSRLLERALADVDAFIAPSGFTRDKHRENGLDIPIVHIPHFLPRTDDPEAAQTGAAAQVAQRPYFLFVGRLTKVKGLQNLIPIFRRYPHADLLVAGEGDYEKELRQHAADVPSVKFLGAVPYPELRRLYRGAIALIASSICYEVFGMTVIEASAERTPVIARNLGGLAETVRESGGGFLYSSDGELIEAMERLRLDPALRSRAGEIAYRSYLEKWTEEAHLRKYFALIHELQARKTRATPTRVDSPIGPAVSAAAGTRPS